MNSVSRFDRQVPEREAARRRLETTVRLMRSINEAGSSYTLAHASSEYLQGIAEYSNLPSTE